MSLTATAPMATRSLEIGVARTTISPALEWLWRYLRDLAQPRVLDCGVTRRATVDTLLHRGAKLYMVDLISSLQVRKGCWDYSRGEPVFRTDKLLAQLPSIPRCSLNAVFCWQLLDLLPREALASVVLGLNLYLQPGGVLFYILRQPYLAKGADAVWWLDNLTTLNREGCYDSTFPYTAITNREMERLVPSGNVKTFLTRRGLREVLAIK